ncbi:ABC transporter substrate-binding protein [Erwinia sp. S38]|uniref:ABC transporter substrate-binding protein n=1 Tax=Erwinia sp. S38 TaxID=2769338 RepID=UPI00190D8ADE|nr:ABC transporter substrate-binding protein [Erwinia sp. S38]MBK0002673.1 ABC transporter substrate-binding protein [Erwinia sp. S38]
MNKLAMGILLALAASGAQAANEKIINFIQCGSKASPGIEENISAFNQANPGYKVVLEVVGWDQCEQKVTTLASAGNAPALAQVGSRTLTRFYQNDLIVPVPLSAAEKGSYYPAVLDTVSYEGQYLGLPVALSTRALFWNKALFKQAGLDPEQPPKTWQELLDDSRIIKEKAGAAGFGLTGKAFSSTTHSFLLWLYSNGGAVLDGDKVVFNSPQAVETLEWYKKILPYAEPGPVAYDAEALRPLFHQGKVAMFMSGSWERGQFPAGLEWGVAPLPYGPHGKPSNLLVTDSLAIFKGTGVEDKAIAFAKFITTPDRQLAYEKGYGFTPVRPDHGPKQLVAEDASWKPFIDGVALGKPEPLFYDPEQFQQTINTAIQQVLLNQATPEQAVKTAAQALEQNGK